LGALFGTIFFLLVSFAAITSAISISEPALAYLVEEYNAKRSRVAISLGVISWILGLGSVLSFNYWADVSVLGQPTFFDFAGFVTDKILLPLGGMFIALFAGWGLPKTVIGAQLGIESGFLAVLWKLLCGILAPAAVAIVFVSTLIT
jgi:NSS family neurotransmitter:Na+ symporter